MSAENRFHLVDVFAERRYAGNQLAVVEDGASLSDEEMLDIAREMNYSETTFVETGEERNGGYDVRIFTPKEEIPFAGHPTLGTAAVLREEFGAGEEVTLNLPVGRIPVEVREADGEELLWMTQNPPEFGETVEPERVAEVLSLDASDVDDEWPVQVVSTGLPAVLIPLTDRDALERIAVDRRAYDELLDDVGVENLFAFCPDPRDGSHDFAARMFALGYNVPEDPATGSANGCLAGYLARHRYFDSPEVSVTVEQGYEMGRPSLLHLEAHDEAEAEARDDGEARSDGDVTVRVGGRVVPVADGTLR
ncbi:PhzF family phenazine biosynthesis protein [Halopelagius longus]|uniref:PhzF family phenazine biosynthesis protein n=1 Tax=Halopelagius longus TaxID=1236180 RepID=A0A1H1EDP6_9EURY|nr:PhzF family phenazine biosynthesis protein [Halopelagius longus]RDI71715.1 PhzF family phenazine biosynthesis protein [Halopelagius longus]SDQ86895.1 trans-2,3-dihydro-3-hydroxyanthranilate isomerase [Halopelagius longus]